MATNATIDEIEKSLVSLIPEKPSRRKSKRVQQGQEKPMTLDGKVS
jgi:hypothetical protein